MVNKKFGTAINCMDGRAQLPVINWFLHKSSFGVDYVDMITEPGADKVLAQGMTATLESIRDKVAISVSKHGSRVVAVVGHADCAGNPCSKEEHRQQIRQGMEIVKSWDMPVEVIGLWLNDDGQVETI